MNKLRRTIRDQGGFRYWFVNVFWFHYKWPVLVGVVVLGIIAFTGVAGRKHRNR